MTAMKAKKIISRVIVVFLLLYMLSFTACEEACWTCINEAGETIEACSESARDIWEALDYICTQN
jgi:hypothetical protein